MSIDQRFDDIRNHFKYKNWTDFAQDFGYNDNQFRSYRKEKAEIPRELEKKLEKAGINFDWLKYGEGEMLSNPDANSSMYNSDTETLSAKEYTAPYSVHIHEPAPLVAGEITINHNYGKSEHPDTIVARMIKNAVKKYENDSQLVNVISIILENYNR